MCRAPRLRRSRPEGARLLPVTSVTGADPRTTPPGRAREPSPLKRFEMSSLARPAGRKNCGGSGPVTEFTGNDRAPSGRRLSNRIITCRTLNPQSQTRNPKFIRVPFVLIRGRSSAQFVATLPPDFNHAHASSFHASILHGIALTARRP